MKYNETVFRQLRAAEKKLHDRFRAALRADSSTEDDRWLEDNFDRLCAALRDARSLLIKEKAVDFSDVFPVCRSYASGRTAAAGTSLRDAFAPLRAPLAVCLSLQTLLAAAAAVNAAEHCGENDGELPKQARFLLSLPETDFRALLPEICEAERYFCADPAGIYPVMDEATKAEYRRRLRKAAEKNGLPEGEAAGRLIDRSIADGGRHIGFYLRDPDARPAPAAFLCLEGLLAAALASLCALLLYDGGVGFSGTAVGAALSGLLLLLPVHAALRPLTDRLCARLFPPRFLPSLSREAPDACFPDTLITVVSVLPSAERSDELRVHLRELYASNSLKNVRLCLLCDLKTAKTPALPTDAADIAAAKRVIDSLNAEFGGGFALLLRDRVFSPTENEYTGYERKRGAVEALVRLLKTGADGFSVIHGDRRFLSAQYMLTLDADTRLPFETLRGLLATAAHPCNRAELRDGKVVSGYGCFSPRTETTLSAAAASVFSMLFTTGGTDAYQPRVSERNMDLFGTGLFCGKGLIDVNAYAAVCDGAFAKGEILSHDVLEGAALRTAFAGGSVVTESFPASPAAYFKRLNRWIRGDAQNLRYVYRPYRKSGVRPDAVTKLRLLDNVRRAVTPILSALCLLLSAFAPSRAAAVLFIAALLSVTAPGLYTAATLFLREGYFAFARRYASRAIPDGLRALLRAVVQWTLLPCEAAVSLDAVCRALYRVFISKKKTLEWTTAAQSEKGGLPVFTAVIPLLFALALIFGGLWQKLSAVLILLALPFAAGNGVPLRERKAPSPGPGETETLRIYAAAMWSYFSTYADERNHWLPPDNVQFVPVRKTAMRTSPTNIGLYLLSILAAADLSLISPGELRSRLTLALASVARLPKYRGLLYNWYSTETLTALRPAFVSTVDCGNYLVCLTVLRAGLQDYAALGGFEDLLRETDALLAEADLAFLYDRRRGLFRVGFDAAAQQFSPSFYDTYMSEARMTSYYAAAKRLIPADHWANLDRRFLRRGLRAAALSYSGTAFEYFMPALFLPVYRNSYQWEGLRACIAVQKKRRDRRYPYGVSESGFYAFDGDMNYSYKAHGLSALALRRDPSDEAVFAPYAAFLFLPFDLRASLRDLARFASLGAYAEHGFFEAVDFTDRAGSEDYMIVRSYMAHHTGMSLLAATNALTGNVFVRRFCADRDMAAALSLLEERVPAGAPVIRVRRKKTPRRPVPGRVSGGVSPDAGLFSDGEVALLCDAWGRNRLRYAGLELLGFSRRSAGVFTAVRTDGRITPLAGQKPYVLRATCCYREENFCGLRIKTAAALLRNSGAMAIPIKAENTEKKPRTAEYLWYFEPAFTPAGRPEAHPAFSDLGIRAEYDAASAALLFRREGGGETGPYLAAAMSDGAPLYFECDRETVLGSDPLRPFPFAERVPSFACDTQFRVPAGAIRATATLRPGERQEKILLLLPGATREEVRAKLSSLRRSRLPDIRRAVPGLPMGGTAAGEAAKNLLLRACFGGEDPARSKNTAENTAPLSALWEAGVSGDLPLILTQTDGLPDALLRELIRMHRRLRDYGVRSDLLLLTARPADYNDAARKNLRQLLQSCGETESRRPGGVWILNRNTCSPAFLSAAAAAPGVRFPAADSDKTAPLPPETAGPLRSDPLFEGKNGFVPDGYFIRDKGPRPWCHTLSNPAFGTLVSAASLGYTWAMNARQNKLTPWSNDVCSDFDGERLLLLTDNAVFDCVSGASVYFYCDRAVYGADFGTATARITVQTDKTAMKKRILVEYRRTGPGSVRFVYKIRPCAADSEPRAATVKIACNNGSAVFTNPSNTDYRGFGAVYADAPAVAQTDGNTLTLAVTPAGELGRFAFYMAFSSTRRGLDALQNLPFRPPTARQTAFMTGDPDLDDFASSLLTHQAYDTRLLARTGFYQCSGAYGFRDQLQDAMHLCRLYPARAKYQILRCAAAQFPEGDVLHWFHAVPFPTPHKTGVRSRCSDDLLWLPLAAARYLEITGDRELLLRPVAFLAGEALRPEEKERCADFGKSELRASVYVHCLRAIEAADTAGEHGLPLIGGGDWNDAFSEVGLGGRGESVWLAMFYRLVCSAFSGVCAVVHDGENEEKLRRTAERMEQAVLKHAYNGSYFLRGFYDDGSPLGAPGCDACEIDLLVQAFAALSETGTPAQRTSALTEAWNRLFDRDAGVVRLFSPPFTALTKRAGYVNDYPAGVRENGGQYTHAAVWFAMALKKEGMEDKAREVLRAILPNTKTGAAAEIFANEPYALTADVRYGGKYTGAGGWSLYTGAAGTLIELLQRWS